MEDVNLDRGYYKREMNDNIKNEKLVRIRRTIFKNTYFVQGMTIRNYEITIEIIRLVLYGICAMILFITDWNTIYYKSTEIYIKLVSYTFCIVTGVTLLIVIFEVNLSKLLITIINSAGAVCVGSCSGILFCIYFDNNPYNNVEFMMMSVITFLIAMNYVIEIYIDLRIVIIGDLE